MKRLVLLLFFISLVASILLVTYYYRLTKTAKENQNPSEYSSQTVEYLQPTVVSEIPGLAIQKESDENWDKFLEGINYSALRVIPNRIPEPTEFLPLPEESYVKSLEIVLISSGEQSPPYTYEMNVKQDKIQMKVFLEESELNKDRESVNNYVNSTIAQGLIVISPVPGSVPSEGLDEIIAARNDEMKRLFLEGKYLVNLEKDG